jgi:hypothetical protein
LALNHSFPQFFEYTDSSYVAYPIHYLFCIYVKYPTLNDIKSSFEEDKKSLILFHDMHLKKNAENLVHYLEINGELSLLLRIHKIKLNYFLTILKYN